MNHPIIPIIILEDAVKQRKRQAPKGRQVDPAALAEVQGLLQETSRKPDMLIEHLHKIQDRFGHLSAAHLAALAQEMGLAQTEVYEVATFYHHFDVVKEGQSAPAALTVRVCDGLSCEMAGAKALLAKLPALLGREVRVISAPCIGRCEQAPAAVVGQNPVPMASTEHIVAAVRAQAIRHEPAGFIDLAAYRAAGGYALLQQCLKGERDVESVIKTLEDAGLRGLGGAGFPAGRKWRIVRAEAGPRLMAINIDEGEPGTFKDRTYLERDPHRFLEGMLIAAWAVGIAKIYIYLRDEYHGCRHMLEAELDKLRLSPPMADMPEIDLRRGAGAYICGEESAMIESIEGKRGLPRLRPPYVAQVGLFGRPTLEHNFETLHWVRELLEKGGAWFASHGRHGRKGLRSFSVSGRVKQPGVLPASLNHIPLDFDTLQAYGSFIGSAAVIVLSDKDTASDAARNMMRFFQHESCGQCTPCRVGTAKAVTLMKKPSWDLALVAELSQVMRDASICGLGQAAPNPMDSVVKYFPHELA
jgi:NADH:ubiquinone oxidoreductase subunit F (NADH-binding)/NADH:ubiquinone oxidoreductase subunit E